MHKGGIPAGAGGFLGLPRCKVGNVLWKSGHYLSKSRGTVNAECSMASPISKLEYCIIVGALQCSVHCTSATVEEVFHSRTQFDWLFFRV